MQHLPDADAAPVRRLDRDAVFAALAAGAAVVTPNRRLARALKREYDRQQVAAGRRVWPAADVLPWGAWLARLHADLGDDRAELLAPPQAQLLWEQVIGASPAAGTLLDTAALAATAADAWATLHAHAGLDALAGAASDDQQAFRGWAREFDAQLRARRLLSAAELGSRLARDVAAGQGRPPLRLVLAGFDVLSPQQRALLAALRERGVQVDDALAVAVAEPAAPRRVEFADPRAQWRAVAAWARARLLARPEARIGIVLPDLEARRGALLHALAEALDPLQLLQPSADRVPPYNLSLGAALADAPLAVTALALFELLAGELDSERAGALLRSPYLGVDDPTLRARLDARLRDDGLHAVDRDALLQAARRPASQTRELARALAEVDALLAAAPRRQAPSRWAQLLFDALRALRCPGPRPLDSAEHQTWQRLRELLAGLATLDTLAGELTLPQAVARLRRLLADTLFQPETPAVPVQVLGVLEAEHLHFDHLWVADLGDDRWPPPSQPNPLLPLALQRAWAVPGAAAEQTLALARRRQRGWLHAAAEVLLSHAASDGDAPCAPSPLIASIPPSPPPVVPAVELASALRSADATEQIEDDHGPVQLPGDVRGGTRLFTDQSACPFRAFAIHRLHAQPLEDPAPGLDARARGSLLHAALAAFWRSLPAQAALLALDPPALALAVADAVEQSLAQHESQAPALAPRARALEAERLSRTLQAWLAVERARPPFEVVALETERAAVVGGLALRVQPDRIDRVGERLLVIDYKTGRVSVKDWSTPRPDEPQLPLYAVSAAERIDALAFAQLRPGDLRFEALAAGDGLLAGAQVAGRDGAPDWDAQLADWRAALVALAQGYLAGDARVDPKDRRRSCEYCALPLLCRIGERAAADIDD